MSASLAATAAVAGVVALAAVAVAAGRVRVASLAIDVDPAATDPAGDAYSNIYAADYVGPEACGACHDERHAGWQGTLHRTMTRPVATDPAPGAVIADFDGATLSYAGGRAVFARAGEAFTMTFGAAGAPPRRYRITRTIGSRYLQEYVGVLVAGPEPRGHPRYDTEIRLPFGWWKRGGGWFHRSYFDSWYGPEYAPDGTLAVDPYEPDDAPWASRCAWCHNTYPFEIRAVRAAARSVGQGTEQYVELTRVRRDAASRRAIAEDNLLPTDELITVGISCESCHLGGRAHAEDDRPIRFVPTSPDLRRRPDAPDVSAGRDSSTLVNTICAQCHSTPAPRYPDGGVTRNSSEAIDMASGACMGAIACIDCHDPHQRGPGAGAADQPAHIAACTGCHAGYADRDRARAHARHDGVSCLDCHMPKMVQGVSQMVRRHRISTPVSPALAAAGAPNACNLCHLDRSITWTAAALADGWGRALVLDPAWAPAWGGDLERPAGEAWLASETATYRIAAAGAYARSPLGRAALPRLLAVLDDPVAYVRMWMVFAAEDILGRDLAYEPTAAPAVRAEQVRILRREEGRVR